MSAPVRAYMPRSALADHRLSGRDLRVLGAVCSLLANKPGPSPLERKYIAELCDLPETVISKVTARLVEFGWVIKSGRGRLATVYSVSWGGNGAEDGTVNGVGNGTVNSVKDGTVNGAASGTVEPPNGVEFGTVGTSNGVKDGTVGTLNGAEDGTVGTLNGVKDGTVNGAEDGTVESGPIKEARARARSGFKLNTTTASNSTVQLQSRVGSEQGGGEAQSFGLSDAIELLVAQGVPRQFLRRQEDRAMVLAWIQDGATEHQIRLACQRARESKTDGKPIGPRYIAPVLAAVREEEKRGNANPQQFDGVDYHAGTWSRR